MCKRRQRFSCGIYMIEHMQVSKYSSSESLESLGWNSRTSVSFLPCLSFHWTRRLGPLWPFRAMPPDSCRGSSTLRSPAAASSFDPAVAAARDPATGEEGGEFLPQPLKDALLRMRRSIAGWHQLRVAQAWFIEFEFCGTGPRLLELATPTRIRRDIAGVQSKPDLEVETNLAKLRRGRQGISGSNEVDLEPKRYKDCGDWIGLGWRIAGEEPREGESGQRL
uniref:Uncharacterized protein n=1 Tax=Arundo donax TaxID=35708 RepID=A0A0A9CME3_ARUDO